MILFETNAWICSCPHSKRTIDVLIVVLLFPEFHSLHLATKFFLHLLFTKLSTNNRYCCILINILKLYFLIFFIQQKLPFIIIIIYTLILIFFFFVLIITTLISSICTNCLCFTFLFYNFLLNFSEIYFTYFLQF